MEIQQELIDESWNDYFSHLSLNTQQSENEIQKCKNCKNEVLYTMNGDVTCTLCGSILECGVISQEAEWNNYSEEGVMNKSNIRCGNVLDYTNPYDTAGDFIPRFMWSWHFDDQGVKRYTNFRKKLQVVEQNMLSENKKLETEIANCFFPCLNGNQNAKAIKIIKVDIMIKYVTTNF